MFEQPVRTDKGEPIEENLRARLARSDALAGTVQPILRHLLGGENATLFGDEILARVRGMAAHLAQQLLAGTTAQDGGKHGPDTRAQQALAWALLDHPALLRHLHALALEWQLAERLEQRFALDPVVPPLLQALLASPDPESKTAGMKVLAAQAAWCQAQRRMQLPLLELPGELLQAALVTLGEQGHDGADADPAARVRADYDEGATRLGLLARLVTSLGGAAVAALDLQHAGAGLFLSALALGSAQDRDGLVLATHEGQALRLALALRGAGLTAAATGQQLLVLHPDLPLPEGLARIGREQAQAMLAQAAQVQG